MDDFEATCRKRNIVVTRKGYSPSSFTYQIECRDVDDVEALSRVIGVCSILNMPLIRTIQPRMFNAKPLPKLPTSGDVIGDFPVVVVVDSGVSDQIPELKSWIVGRDSQVAPQYQNTDHGSFVAGLVCWGSALNPTIGGLDDSPCGIFDLQVLPKGDPARGNVLELLESELLVSLKASLKEHASRLPFFAGSETVLHTAELGRMLSFASCHFIESGARCQSGTPGTPVLSAFRLLVTARALQPRNTLNHQTRARR